MPGDSGTRETAPVLWFTGLSGSGKSTIAVRVHQELLRRGMEVEYIDGDALREVFPQTGFTREEREEHLRRTGYMASRLAFFSAIACIWSSSAWASLEIRPPAGLTSSSDRFFIS